MPGWARELVRLLRGAEYKPEKAGCEHDPIPKD